MLIIMHQYTKANSLYVKTYWALNQILILITVTILAYGIPT